jgi:transposase InsO family protein
VQPNRIGHAFAKPPVTFSEIRNFCIEALQEALGRYGTPEIFNTDQGRQFTSEDFTDVLKENGIQISMDVKGRWVDFVLQHQENASIACQADTR